MRLCRLAAALLAVAYPRWCPLRPDPLRTAGFSACSCSPSCSCARLAHPRLLAQRPEGEHPDSGHAGAVAGHRRQQPRGITPPLPCGDERRCSSSCAACATHRVSSNASPACTNPSSTPRASATRQVTQVWAVSRHQHPARADHRIHQPRTVGAVERSRRLHCAWACSSPASGCCAAASVRRLARGRSMAAVRPDSPIFFLTSPACCAMAAQPRRASPTAPTARSPGATSPR